MGSKSLEIFQIVKLPFQVRVNFVECRESALDFVLIGAGEMN